VIRLLGDRIMVKLEKPPETRHVADGIELIMPPGSHGAESELHVWGEVLAVGPGKWARRGDVNLGFRLPMEVAVGDRVMVTWFIGKTQTAEGVQAVLGDDIVIITPEDVLCHEARNTDGAAVLEDQPKGPGVAA